MPERIRPVRPPKVDPFTDVPIFDPAAPDNPPPPPGSTALTKPDLPEPPDGEIPDDARAVRERLKALAREMLNPRTTPARLKQLGLEVQRARLAEKLYTEAESGASDPDTYRELSMLNRMLAGEEDLDEPTTDEARLAEAEAVLAGRGIDPAQARRILRALESVNAAPEADHDDAPRRRQPVR